MTMQLSAVQRPTSELLLGGPPASPHTSSSVVRLLRSSAEANDLCIVASGLVFGVHKPVRNRSHGRHWQEPCEIEDPEHLLCIGAEVQVVGVVTPPAHFYRCEIVHEQPDVGNEHNPKRKCK